MKPTTIAVKAYSLTDLSKIYRVCIRTIKKWLAPFAGEIGKRIGRYYTITQVRIIFQKLGLPNEIDLE
jgi:hypothetical protein